MTDLTHPLFLLGPGYSARRLARIWSGSVYGTVRRPDKMPALQADGIRPVLLGDDEPDLAACLTGAHLVISAPPGPDGCPALACLQRHIRLPRSVTYLSTTGVYGDRQGGWVFEWSQTTPQTPRSERRVAAEQGWQQSRPDTCVVRLPGIYGPGRSAIDRVREGTARRIVKPGQVFSRIHVSDLASGLVALIEARAQGVFHLCDEGPAPPQDVTRFAADLLGVDPGQEIPFDAAGLSEMARGFYSECKRVANARIKSATGWRPAYPTYREGLRAILNESVPAKA